MPSDAKKSSVSRSRLLTAVLTGAMAGGAVGAAATDAVWVSRVGTAPLTGLEGQRNKPLTSSPSGL